MNASIKIFLMGGMGNNLFQFSRALELHKNNYDVEIIYLSKRYLFLFGIIGHTVRQDFFKIGKVLKSLDLASREANLLDLAHLGLTFLKRKIGLSSYFNLSLEDLKKVKKKDFLDVGYFQSKEHISLESINLVSKSLIKIFKIKKKLNDNEFVLHFRATDSDSKNRPSQKDLESLIHECVKQNKVIKVATDDRKKTIYVFQEFNQNISFISDDSIDDFKYLAASKNIFLSNSSYAFWAGICAKNIRNDLNLFASKTWQYEDFLSTKKFE